MSKSKKERKCVIALLKNVYKMTNSTLARPVLSQQSCINLTYNASNEPVLSLHSC